jgi:hypothetical protein
VFKAAFSANTSVSQVLRQRRDNTPSPVNNWSATGRPFRLYIWFRNQIFPMALTPQDIGRIANLARLELQPEESERMLTQLNGFLASSSRCALWIPRASSRWPTRSPAIQDMALRCATTW